jgi:HEPN domain-containing protein
MDKNQHIQYWIITAQDDWDTVEYLYEGKRYVQALFFTHLAIEKLLKAFWVKNNIENTPPKTHNLGYLVEKSRLEIAEDDLDFLLILSDYQIEGRYPDYLTLLHKNTQQERAVQVIADAKNIFQWLKEKLQ